MVHGLDFSRSTVYPLSGSDRWRLEKAEMLEPVVLGLIPAEPTPAVNN